MNDSDTPPQAHSKLCRATGKISHGTQFERHQKMEHCSFRGHHRETGCHLCIHFVDGILMLDFASTKFESLLIGCLFQLAQSR